MNIAFFIYLFIVILLLFSNRVFIKSLIKDNLQNNINLLNEELFKKQKSLDIIDVDYDLLSLHHEEIIKNIINKNYINLPNKNIIKHKYDNELLVEEKRVLFDCLYKNIRSVLSN
jgi:cell division protein FtsL